MCTCDKMSPRCVQQYSLLHASKRERLITFPVFARITEDCVIAIWRVGDR